MCVCRRLGLLSDILLLYTVTGSRVLTAQMHTAYNRQRRVHGTFQKALITLQAAEECLQTAGDLSGLLLLYTVTGSRVLTAHLHTAYGRQRCVHGTVSRGTSDSAGG